MPGSWLPVSSFVTSLVLVVTVEDAVIYRVSKRFGDNHTVDVWTSQTNVLLEGSYSLVDCMSLCTGRSTCWSFSHRDPTTQCRLFTSAYASEEQSLSALWDYYVFTGCPDGWIVSGDKCYLFNTDGKMNWYDAQTFCGGYGAKLAEPKTQDDYYEMENLSSRSNGLYWIGGTDELLEDNWIWSKTGENITFTVWDNNQPNEGILQNCLATYLKSTTSKAHWHDRECDTQLAYPICERFYIV